MPKLQIIGCSTGMPEANVAMSSYLLTFKGTSYLFDCGEGTSSAMLRLGVNYNNITAVFISHGHPDHVIGLPVFLQMNYMTKRTAPLDIYLPSELVKPIEEIIGAGYLLPQKSPFEWRIHAMRPNPAYRGDGLAVNIFLNNHLSHAVNRQIIEDNKLPNKMQSYCFSIVTAGSKMVYSGDIASVSDLDGWLDNTDLLIIEGRHPDLGELFEKAAHAGVGKLILTHLLSLSRKKRESIRATAEKLGIKELCFAEEGDVHKY